MEKFELIVIGGGPGGYVAAIRAAQLGLRVALVESTHLGGVCLNWGCIPTKALLRAAEINYLLHNLPSYGFHAKEVGFDLEKVVGRSRSIASQLSRGVAHLLKKAKVSVFSGVAKLDGKEGTMHRVIVSGQEAEPFHLATPNVILATGARARALDSLRPDGKIIWTAREAMTPKSLPKDLLVIGSGAIGVEFASFYHNMGVKVTIVELADRILPVEDAEISALARKSFERQGITIYTGAKIGPLKTDAKSVSTTIETSSGKISLTCERAILAIGIVGNTENLGLEATKVKVEKTHVVTNGVCQTDEPGIWAIGDLTAPPWLAHKASHEGVICAEKIAGKQPEPLHPLNIPGCTYSRPQIASVGLTEEKACALGREIKIGRFPFSANGKALAMGEPEGLTKTIFDAKTGELLGAHMIGAEVTEMIQGYVIARQAEVTEAELMETVFPHPTISETMHEAVLSAFGSALHI